MQEHLIREANFYLKTLIDLQKRNMAKKESVRKRGILESYNGRPC